VSVLVLVLSVAACGGSTKSTSTPPQITASTGTATTTTAAAPKAPAIHTGHEPRKTPAKGTAAAHTAPPARASPSTGSKTHNTTSSQTTPTSASRPSSTTPVHTRPIHGRLVGENHAPKVNQAWSYSVTLTDAKGQPMSGTVDIEFALAGQVVGHETPPTHRLTNGRWHDTLRFPAQSVGVPLDVQAVVHTSLGSVTLDWAVKVQH
jgi:hypothetical protein